MKQITEFLINKLDGNQCNQYILICDPDDVCDEIQHTSLLTGDKYISGLNPNEPIRIISESGESILDKVTTKSGVLMSFILDEESKFILQKHFEYICFETHSTICRFHTHCHHLTCQMKHRQEFYTNVQLYQGEERLQWHDIQ